MSGGVVWSPSSPRTGRFGNPLSLGANALIPAGTWYTFGAFTVTCPDASTHSVSNGYCLSDGTNVTLNTAGVIVPIGP